MKRLKYAQNWYVIGSTFHYNEGPYHYTGDLKDLRFDRIREQVLIFSRYAKPVIIDTHSICKSWAESYLFFEELKEFDNDLFAYLGHKRNKHYLAKTFGPPEERRGFRSAFIHVGPVVIPGEIPLNFPTRW